MRRSGFSLTELLIAVAVMAVIAGIGLSTYADQLSRGRDQKRMADIAQIQSALEKYRADNGEYPRAAGVLNGDLNNCDASIGNISRDCTTPAPGSVNPGWKTSGGTKSALLPLRPLYIEELPLDPINDREHYYGYESSCHTSATRTLCGRQITCSQDTCCAYELSVVLENDTQYRVCSPSS